MGKKTKGQWLIFSFIISCFLGIVALEANPFAIDFPAKENLSNEDFLYIQDQLRSIDITPLLKELYPDNDPNYTSFDDFSWRCNRGLRQTFIDPKNGRFPTRQLKQIGEKSSMCFVTCVPYDRIYPDLVRKLPKVLKKVGFNGFFLYYMGGFPNPTGKEIQYAGVPYSFKIFAMLEAYKLGFKKVLWIDAAVLPLRDPTPLFEWLDKHEAFLMEKKGADTGRYVLPATRQLLKDLTRTDVLDTRFIRTIVFGLKMNSPKVQKLIETYYEFVKLGAPFLSCYPEEFVLTSIIGQEEFKHWKMQPFKLLKGSDKQDDRCKIKKAKDEGFYFYHLSH